MKTSKELILFCSISEYGKGSEILNYSQELGAYFSTTVLGKGTINNSWLNFLGVMDTRKEITLSIIDKAQETNFHDKMNQKFHLDKPNHGITFSMPLKQCYSQKRRLLEQFKEYNHVT